MYRRAVFLEALQPSPPRRVIPMPSIVVSDDPPSSLPPAAADDVPTKTFNSAVAAALELGKQMTKTLYASEGKPITSDAGLPAAFVVRFTLSHALHHSLY